jgi:hypothetical protein
VLSHSLPDALDTGQRLRPCAEAAVEPAPSIWHRGTCELLLPRTFPYRQLHMIWRLQGLWQYLRGDMAWRTLNRQGLQSVGTD